MNREAIVALFDRRSDAWKRRDAVALAANHAEDAVVESPMLGRIESRARIEQVYRDWLTSFPDLTYTSKDLLIDGDRVAEFFGIRGTQSAPFGDVPATGRRIDFNGVCLFTIGHDNLFVREQRVYDVTAVLVQLGMIKGTLVEK